MNNSEKIKKPSGQIGMILHKGGEYDINTGKIVGGEVIKTEEFHNLIVDKASQLMAARLAPGQMPGVNTGVLPQGIDGLQYLVVGVGICENPLNPWNADTNKINTDMWDMQNPPPPSTDVTKLQGEIFRKQFTNWCFVNQSGNDIIEEDPMVPVTVTNMLKLVTTFNENEAVGPLTEMGLFGGNATDERNSGYMFNYKTFPVWNKTSDAKLTITWRLTF